MKFKTESPLNMDPRGAPIALAGIGVNPLIIRRA